MEQSKILTPSIASSASYSLDEEDYLYFIGSGGGGGGGYGITQKTGVRLSLKYTLALLNSTLLDYFLKKSSTTFSGGYFAYNRQYIERLPIYPINFAAKGERAVHDVLVGLADRILKAKRTNPLADTIALEREIDERVYRLYGLTPEEIKIVEESAR